MRLLPILRHMEADPDKSRHIGVIEKVIIRKYVWIGSNITILKNSYLGDNSNFVIGSVISGTFPENVIN